MNHYIVQLVEHVNYTAFIEADSQEQAEKLAATHTNNYNWERMDGPNPTEIYTQDEDYLEGVSLNLYNKDNNDYTLS